MGLRIVGSMNKRVMMISAIGSGRAAWDKGLIDTGRPIHYILRNSYRAPISSI